MALAVELCDWIFDLDLESVPADVVADGRRRILDVVGLALATTRTPLGRAVREGGIALSGGAQSSGGARVVGFADRLPPANAAMINATLAHGMDFDDTHLATLVHPSAPIVSTALAIGEAFRISGREVLTAVIAGDEVSCRLGMAAPGAFHAKGLHPTSVLCTPVSALIAARLLELDRTTAVNAVGIACSQSSGLLESFQDGTWVKTLHPGWAAHAGIAAALLARAGFTGPATGLDGRFGLLRALLDGPSTRPDLAALRDGLGEHWENRSNFFKLYPCAHVILPFVEMALELREGGYTPANIARIDIEIGERYIPVVCEPREAKISPRTNTHARASLAYAVAAALVHGSLDVHSYSDAAIHDPAVKSFAARIFHRPLTVEPTGEPTGEGFPGVLTATLRDGSETRLARVSRSGHPLDPGTPAAVAAKFNTNALTAITPAAADEIARTIGTIETVATIDRLADAWTTNTV